jgi:hypothetical protein
VVALRLGYGDAKSPFALAPAPMMVAYAVAVWWFFFSVFAAIGKVAQAALVPFRRGTYLFPGGVVEARSAQIAVTPATDLVRCELVAGGAALRLGGKDGRSFELPVVIGPGEPRLVELRIGPSGKLRRRWPRQTHDVSLLDRAGRHGTSTSRAMAR